MVQRGRGFPGERCVAALRPPPGVLHQHTQDAGRLPGGDPIQFGQQTVIALVAAQRGHQRQLRQRHRGQAGLPGAAGQLDRFGGMGHRAGPVPAREVGQRQPRQREQDQADRPVVAGLGQHAAEQAAEAVVVAEVEGRDPEVGQQVRLGQVMPEGDGLPQGNGRGGQAVVVQLVEPGQQMGETPCPG